MKPDEFVKALWNAAPSVQAMLDNGLEEEETEEIRILYRCVPRDQPLPAVDTEDPLLALMAGWDLAHVHVGCLHFIGEPEHKECGRRVGTYWCLADLDLILGPAGDVFVESPDGPGVHRWDCAKDSGAFLDALVPLADWLGRRATTEDMHEEDGTGDRRAEECAKLAGGQKYLPFWLNAIG